MCFDLVLGLPATSFGLFGVLAFLTAPQGAPHGGGYLLMGGIIFLVPGLGFLAVAHAMWHRLPGRWFAQMLPFFLPFCLFN